MPYADTDFFIALLKENDRFSESANRLFLRYRGNITTSLVTILELTIICKRMNINTEKLLASVLTIAKVNDAESMKLLFAAHLIETERLSPFDAFHAVLCEGEIISSDHIYDRIGIERIRLS